ncbi:protein C12orf4-like isoform X2 [Gordionus sp. m RMFG-2023]|uniref:protein C12orf4-like isoform X2 n=1 Tax=Gordionus sp. m RMFG-2023 TaxID=3053472 RepID=UPI0031FBA5F2
MDIPVPECITRSFIFEYEEILEENGIKKVILPICIPNEIDYDELIGQYITEYNIPPYEEEKSINHYKFVTNTYVNAFLNSNDDIVSKIADHWASFFENEPKFSESTGDLSKNLKDRFNEMSDEEIFAEAYTHLIMTQYLETMLQLEDEHLIHIRDLLKQRDQDIINLNKKNKLEMEDALNSNINKLVSSLANSHSDEMHLSQSSWDSKLTCVKAVQRKELREWVMKVYEDDILLKKHDNDSVSNDANGRIMKIDKDAKNKDTLILNSCKSDEQIDNNLFKITGDISDVIKNINIDDDTHDSCRVFQEESFSVHLGCQLKSMYNLRLLKCNYLPHFCDFQNNSRTAKSYSPDPVKLQTLLTLYTDKLNAIILIEDGRLNPTVPGMLNELAKICEKSTEYHFPDLDHQLDNVRRICSSSSDVNAIANNDNFSSRIMKVEVSGDIKSTERIAADPDQILETGDVYITRHSNLSRTHVVFHLCVNEMDEWNWLGSGMDTSVRQHFQLFEGLRNIVKTCFSLYDVQSLTIPLLLGNQLNEEMTLNWCLKRAELVFKCVKGYVIESQSFSSSPLYQPHIITSSTVDSSVSHNKCKIVQFQLPAQMSETAFDNICNTLPNIFRLPTPIVR